MPTAVRAGLSRDLEPRLVRRAVMPSPRRLIALLFWTLLVLAAAQAPGSLAATKDPLKVPPRDILVTTSIPVAPGLSATLVEFMTGERKERTAIDLLLGVYRTDADQKVLIASRDYNDDAGGYVSRGSLQVMDLDRDGSDEIMVEYHHREQPGAVRVEMDLLRCIGGRLQLAWTGPVRVDTTSPSLGMPPAERERFVREIDLARTALLHDGKIYFTKTVSVAAGAVIDPPRSVPEEVPLAPVRSAPSSAADHPSSATE